MSVIAGCIDYFGALKLKDIVYIWLYNLLGLIVIDIFKVGVLKMFNENTEVLDEPEPVQDASHAQSRQVKSELIMS